MDLVGSAFTDDDDLGWLIEFSGSSVGEDLELADGIERRDLAFATLEGHLLVCDSVER